MKNKIKKIVTFIILSVFIILVNFTNVYADMALPEGLRKYQNNADSAFPSQYSQYQNNNDYINTYMIFGIIISIILLIVFIFYVIHNNKNDKNDLKEYK